jgi:hypothetical protein
VHQWPGGHHGHDDPLGDRPGLGRFANVKHFCSRLGLCPSTRVSGGKVLSACTRRSTNRVRQALKLAAMSLSRNDSALGAFYRRLCSRMDKPRVNTAVAHKLARMMYFMHTRSEASIDQGQQHYEEHQRQRSIDALRRRATALRFQITPAPKPHETSGYQDSLSEGEDTTVTPCPYPTSDRRFTSVTRKESILPAAVRCEVQASSACATDVNC